MVLASDELTALRAAILETLPDTCTITSPGVVADLPDAYGNPTYTPSTSASVACRAAQLSSTEAARLAGLDIVASWSLTFPDHTAITEDDSITWTPASGDATRVFQLVGLGGGGGGGVGGAPGQRSQQLQQRHLATETVD